MSELRILPNEIIDNVIEFLVITIGIKKAIRLRIVDRAFNTAIMAAICVRQVVSVHHSSAESLWWHMGHSLRARISLSRSRCTEILGWLADLASINRALDSLTGVNDLRLLEQQHKSVAETICATPFQFETTLSNETRIDKWKDQNLLSGAIVIGNLPLVKYLLAPESPAPFADVNGATPMFGRPLTLAAAWGQHIEIVRFLLRSGGRPDIICGVH